MHAVIGDTVRQSDRFNHFPYARYNQANIISDKATSDICREQSKKQNVAIGHSPLYCF
jgi:hypothetical protein